MTAKQDGDASLIRALHQPPHHFLPNFGKFQIVNKNILRAFFSAQLLPISCLMGLKGQVVIQQSLSSTSPIVSIDPCPRQSRTTGSSQRTAVAKKLKSTCWGARSHEAQHQAFHVRFLLAAVCICLVPGCLVCGASCWGPASKIHVNQCISMQNLAFVSCGKWRYLRVVSCSVFFLVDPR